MPGRQHPWWAPDLGRLRELLSVVQVGLSVLAVWLGTGGSPWAILTALVLTGLAFVRPLPNEPSLVGQRLWTALVFVALVGSIVRGVVFEELIDAGIDFLLLLCVQRFFNRQKTREHLQLQMLAAVLMVIAAVINTELSYPIILTLYLPLAVMGLVVNLLMAEGERLGVRVQHDLAKTSPARHRRLWSSSLQVAGAAALAGLIVFVTFPRVGVGMFLRGAMPNRVQSGFSEQVRLGGFGTIKSDPTVVMRIEPDDDAPIVDHTAWHIRGSAFDRYEDGLWSHSPSAETLDRPRGVLRFKILQDDRGPLAVAKTGQFGREEFPELQAVSVPGFANSTETMRGTVTVEDIGTDLVFVPGEPLAVALSSWNQRSDLDGRNLPQLVVTEDRQFAIAHRKPGPARYVYFSRARVPTAEEMRSLGDPEVPERLGAYLQVSDELSPEFEALAREITQGAQTRYDKVDAVMTWLANLDYTADILGSEMVDNGADPVEGFVFETKAGHCEYFATAGALLLREVGVPTRNVNGYYGAEWNPVGEFYAVRQAGAHSWMEVYFDDLGWVTFDPTPPSGREAGRDAAFFPRMTQMLDAMRNAYLGYVIDYDLGTQLSMLENLGVAKRERGLPKINWRGLIWWGVLPPVALALFGLIRVWRKRASVNAELAAYHDVLAVMARDGWPREDHESPRAFAQRLCANNHRAAAAVEAFARHYEALRFGPPLEGRDPKRLAQLEQLEQLRRSVRRSLDRPSDDPSPSEAVRS